MTRFILESGRNDVRAILLPLAKDEMPKMDCFVDVVRDVYGEPKFENLVTGVPDGGFSALPTLCQMYMDWENIEDAIKEFTDYVRIILEGTLNSYEFDGDLYLFYTEITDLSEKPEPDEKQVSDFIDWLNADECFDIVIEQKVTKEVKIYTSTGKLIDTVKEYQWIDVLTLKRVEGRQHAEDMAFREMSFENLSSITH